MMQAFNHPSTTFHGYLRYMVILLDTLSVGSTVSGGNDTAICINSPNCAKDWLYTIIYYYWLYTMIY